jgi:hypothetical protein
MIINTDNFAINFLPSKKRLPVYSAFARVLLKPLQILYSTMFGTFKSGNNSANWSNATAYVVGNQVKYIDKAIYQCWVAHTNKIPTDTAYWFKIQDKFVGIEPRLKYNAQHLLFEWALNQWFGTTFVNSPGDSDIYIVGNALAQSAFYVGGNETNSSLAVKLNGEAVSFIQAENLANSSIEFNIYVPVAVWTALDTDATNRDKIIRQIADLYVYGGINYEIIAYP